MLSTQLRVGIKFCGHCNPQIEGSELVARLKRRLPQVETVRWQLQDYHVLLVVSACPVNCVSDPPFEGPKIYVAGRELRHRGISPGHAAEQLLQACLDEGLMNIT